MGSSIFGGGTSQINSTTNSNSNTNYNTNQNQTQQQAQSGSSMPAGFQMPYLNDALSSARWIYDNLSANQGAPQLNYTSLLSPQFAQNATDLEGAAINNANRFGGAVATGQGLLPAFNSAAGAAGSVLGRSMSDPTQANIAAAGQYANNPYTQGMIKAAQTPIERQLKEVAVPNLNIGASGTGNTDSSRAAMTEAILRRSAGEDEANVAANILGNQYNSGLNLAEGARTANLNAGLNAGGLFNNVGNSGANLMTSGNNSQISDLNVPIQIDQMYQQDQNAQNQVNYQNATGATQFPWSMLNNYYGIVGRPLGTETTGTAVGSGTGTTSGTSQTQGTNLTNGTQTQPGPGVLGGLLGAASGIGSFFAPTGAFGAGPSIAASIFGLSDRRAKTDISRVGTLDNGLPVYVFRYRGDNTPQIGLMADDVEKVKPHAVVTGPHGLKMVNYKQAVE